MNTKELLDLLEENRLAFQLIRTEPQAQQSGAIIRTCNDMMDRNYLAINAIKNQTAKATND